MSPAAVEIRSSDAFSSNDKPPSAPHNPKAAPDGSTSLPQTIHSQMNLGNAGEFDCGFGFDSRSSFHSKPAASFRPRPRLVKLRKQFNGKVRTGETEVLSGFNPFKQSGQNSTRVSTSGNPSTSEFLESLNKANNDNNNSDNNNKTFVFGVNSGSDAESSGNVEAETGNDEPVDKFGFVFGANGSDVPVKLNPGKGSFGDSAVSLDATGFQGSEGSNLEFTFGSIKSNLASNMNSGKPDFCEAVKVPYFRDAGFVFGSSQSDLKSTFSSEKVESTNFVGGSSSTFGASDFGKMKMEGETASQKMGPTTVNLNANGSGSWIGDSADGFFVFGATSRKSSFSDKYKDGINSSTESFGVSASNVRYKEAFESSNHFASSSPENSVFILEDDLEKLNISCPKNIGGTNTIEDSDTKGNPEIIFPFNKVNGAVMDSFIGKRYQRRNKGN